MSISKIKTTDMASPFFCVCVSVSCCWLVGPLLASAVESYCEYYLKSWRAECVQRIVKRNAYNTHASGWADNFESKNVSSRVYHFFHWNDERFYFLYSSKNDFIARYVSAKNVYENIKYLCTHYVGICMFLLKLVPSADIGTPFFH